MKFKELLPTRIPEFQQGDNDLKHFLEVAGELFDEYNDRIEEFDTYHDPATVAAHRLHILAKEFAISFPRNINVDLQRTIIRDLEAIYQKQGTVDIIHWIFRLVGWDVTIENAWVLNPEYYDPAVMTEFELDDYDSSKKIAPTITNYYDRDYRAFLLGNDLTFENGTYFRGRKFFDIKDSFLKNEIIGEYYDERVKSRTPNKVMATPYLFIRVSEETYNIFIKPYEDPSTGQIFDYTELEFFDVVSNIFDFFLFDAMRPSHVRVVIIVAPQHLHDEAVIDDEYTEAWDAEPLELTDIAVFDDEEPSMLHHTALVGDEFLAGTPPSPFNKDMVINPIAYRKLVGSRVTNKDFIYVDHEQRKYSIVNNETDYIGPRCGAYDWKFITPHEESFSFMRIYTPEDDVSYLFGDGGQSKPYPDDLDTIHLNFDLLTDTYGYISANGVQTVTIRNPTTITSYCFNPNTVPANQFKIGNRLPDGTFDKNLLLEINFDKNQVKYDNAPKAFFYVYDMSIQCKVNNLDSNWIHYITNPKIGDLNNLTEYNTFAPKFNYKHPYDFEFDVKYEEQPHWENRY